MLNFNFFESDSQPNKILCLGAHSDDIEIGCGGSILKLLNKFKNVDVCWVVFSCNDERAVEARNSAESFLTNAMHKRIDLHSFNDSFFPYIGADIKKYFELLKREFSPDLIFTHFRHDLHQDHRLISELTWNTFRNHLILEYEIIKYDGDLGHPNLFINLDEPICRRKVSNVLKFFKTQENHRWFTEDTFTSMLRIRGIESNAPQKYAEAFYCRKIIF